MKLENKISYDKEIRATPMNERTIELQAVSKSYPLAEGETRALMPLSLHIPLGKITTIVGKSGCGKTTLLKLLAGLEEPSMGAINIPSPLTTADMAMVFQEARLLPWKTVKENMALATLAGEKISEAELKHYLEILHLTKFADAYPHQLSGGMAQRVALGRALCAHKSILLMDEPFGALDYFTRLQLQEDVYSIYEKEKKTVIFVTHDIAEALLLGDEILCLQADGTHQLLHNSVSYLNRSNPVSVKGLYDQVLEAIGGKYANK